MKNVLIVFAHPESKSMNGMLKEKAIQVMEELGHQVRVSNLYAIDFPASVKKSDFSFYQSDFFDLQVAQVEAQKLNQQPEFIRQEQEQLLWAEVIIFQFPLWWYSVPAVLKSYFDNVFSAGFAYAGNYVLEGKKYMLSFTTGAPEFAWTADRKGTIEQVLFHLDIGTFQMLRVDRIPPFIGYGTKRMSEAERQRLISAYEEHLYRHFK